MCGPFPLNSRQNEYNFFSTRDASLDGLFKFMDVDFSSEQKFHKSAVGSSRLTASPSRISRSGDKRDYCRLILTEFGGNPWSKVAPT